MHTSTLSFALAQAICRSLSDEARAAQLEPELAYSPYVEGWREKRQDCPQRYRRQGLPLGRLNTALDGLHVTRPEGAETLMSFGEFEPLFDGLEAGDLSSGPGAARDLLLEFEPGTRPVLWRVLVIQALLYWCYQETVFGGGIPDQVDLLERFSASDVYARLSTSLEGRSGASATESIEITASVAAAYFVDRVAPALKRVDMLAQASQRSSDA